MIGSDEMIEYKTTYTVEIDNSEAVKLFLTEMNVLALPTLERTIFENLEQWVEETDAEFYGSWYVSSSELHFNNLFSTYVFSVLDRSSCYEEADQWASEMATHLHEKCPYSVKSLSFEIEEYEDE